MTTMYIATGTIAAFVIAISIVIYYRRFKPIKVDRFQDRWNEIQKLCGDRTLWASVVLNADKLLDEALKKKHITGKTMGERMVKAQRIFTDNDSVWFGHKLRNKIDSDPEVKLKENEVKDALIGIRQALKDLGALRK